MKDDIKDKAIHWAACQKEGLNEIEKRNLEYWLAENPKHQEAFNNAKRIHRLFENIPKNYSEEISLEVHNSAKKIKFIQKVKPLFSVVASLLLVFILGFKAYETYLPSYDAVYITKNDILKTNSLPDGSKITLDVESDLNVKIYNDKREVVLNKGQAFFDVAKDKNKAFIINAGKIQIEVLGTKFEVQKFDKHTNVSVKEGLVKVSYIYYSNKKAKTITRLKKGETIEVATSGKINSFGKVDIDEIASWKEGKLIFNKSSLKDAFDTFSRYHKMDIKLDASLHDSLFSGSFKTNELDKFLNAIEKVYSLQIKKYNNQITILSK